MDLRYNRGEEHGRAKLTARQVLQIRNNSRASYRLLAIRYGVSPACIHKIKNNKTWRE